MAVLNTIQEKKDESIREIMQVIKELAPEGYNRFTEVQALVVRALERVMETDGVEKRDGRER